MGSLRTRARPEDDVNPPFREAAQAPGDARPDAPELADPPRRPVVATAENQIAEDDPGRPEPAAEGGETDPSGSPAPVLVPYARTGLEPDDVVSAPPVRTPRRPARSPFWAAVHSHLWLGVIILVLVGAAGTAYWGLRVHQRIGEATLERGIGTREHASTVRCIEQQANGAVWACGVVYNAESVCLIANVNPAGEWSTKPGTDLCTHRPALAALLPTSITASAVVADLKNQHSSDVSKCAKILTRKVRWACVGPGGPTTCVEVRIVPWTPWVPNSSDACAHVPVLRKFLGKRT